MLELEINKLAAITSKDDDMDEDIHFAKSLVPFLRRLKPLRKLIIRNDIQTLLIRELANESPSTSSATDGTDCTYTSL